MEKMTKETLEEKLKELGNKYNYDRKQIYKEFAFSNNSIKNGDVITDHIGTIKVEKIGVNVSFGIACCTYTGIELKKDGTPKKGEPRRTVYQNNLI